MKRSFRVSTTTSLSANRFVTSVAQANGAYTLANSGQPTTPTYATTTSTRVWPGVYPNGRLTTAAVTQAGGANDTPGTLTVTGITPNGNVATDTLTLAVGSTVTGVVPFTSVRAPVQAGWAIDTGGTPTADTIVVGHAAGVIPYLGDGTLESIFILTTAASAVTIADRDSGSSIVLPNSFAVGYYLMNWPFFGYLSITHAGASDIIYTFNTNPPDAPTLTRT